MLVLGHSRLFAIGETTAYGAPTGPKLFIGRPFGGGAVKPGNGPHLAFIVNDRATVQAFHAMAVANGGGDEGPPRPHYHANCYAAYVRDPDGNKLQAVCHSAPNG